MNQDYNYSNYNPDRPNNFWREWVGAVGKNISNSSWVNAIYGNEREYSSGHNYNSSADAIQPTKAEVIEMLGKTLEKLNQNVNLSKSKLHR